MRTSACVATLLAVFVASPLALSVAMATHIPCHNLSWVRDYNFAPYIDSNPHGKLNVLVSISKLGCDGTTSYDWYFYHVQVQSVPGKVAYGSDWLTEYHGDKHTVWSPGTYRWLADYDPTTTSGYDSSTVSAGVTVSDSPQFSFTKSDSYAIPWVRVLDYSDYSVHRAQWNHEFNKDRDTASATFRVRPWFVVKTTQDQWSYIDGYYEIRFAHMVVQYWPYVWWWWEGQTFPGSTVYLDVQRSGDS